MSSYSIYLLMPGLSHIALSLIVLSVCASPPQPVSWYFWFTQVFSFFHLALFLCSFLSLFLFLPFCPYFLSYFLLPFLIFLGFVSVFVLFILKQSFTGLGLPFNLLYSCFIFLGSETEDVHHWAWLIPCVRSVFILLPGPIH